MKSMTSSGLLLLLLGTVGMAAFVNGALPRLLDTLFSPGAKAGSASAAMPASSRPTPSVGSASVGQFI